MADAAHRGVWERHQDQVLVVTGESGSGKTEACKLVLQYVAAVTPGASHDARMKLLQSNPILEGKHLKLILIFKECKLTKKKVKKNLFIKKIISKYIMFYLKKTS